jgi:hypothetical protein
VPSVDIVNRCKEFTIIYSANSLPVSIDYTVLTIGELQISDSGLREEHSLRVFESRVPRGMFGPERGDSTGG